MTNGRKHKGDLEYNSDGLRDIASSRGRDPDEQHIQASMQEETAKAMHRVAAAIEDLTEAVEGLDEDKY